MFKTSKLQKYIIVYRVPGSHVSIQASIEMDSSKAESLLPAFGMKTINHSRLGWLWKPKNVFLTWDELQESGVPVQNPRFIWASFDRLRAAGWTIESQEFTKYYWWIFN